MMNLEQNKWLLLSNLLIRVDMLECFLDVSHVRDTTSSTFHYEICSILSHHNLNIQNVRDQGYDGASNIHGEWNGLQTLILHECPYAYYVHCLAHKLLLAFVASTNEVVDVHDFFFSKFEYDC